MQQLGATMVAVSDHAGAIRNDYGIDAELLHEHVREGGTVGEFPDGETISGDELLDVECELRCRMVVEGANGPTTPAADEILRDKGIFVVPDLMANASGVVVSYFEWVQNLQHFRWDEREVNDRLGRIMRKAFREVSARAKAGGVPMRVAAYGEGISRVVEASTTRGYIS